jgi:hypothetical protein
MLFDEKMLVEANEYILVNDRSLYDPFFEMFEEYCATNDVVYTMISGANCILKKNDPSIKPKYNSYFITVCCTEPEKVAIEVCNKLTTVKTNHINNRNISYMRSGSDFTIMINTRQCFKITSAPMYRDATVDSLVGNMQGLGLWTGREVKCQNIYSLLSYLLSQSYDPRGTLDIDIIRGIVDIIRPNIKTGSKQKNKAHGHVQDRTKIIDYISGRDNVYVVDDKSFLQTFVIDAQFDDLRKELESQFTIRVAKYNLHDLDDFALTKYIIHDSNEKAVCAVFNSLEHQVIPIRGASPQSTQSTKNKKMVSRRYAARINFLEIQMLKMMSHIGRDMSPVITDTLRRALTIVDDPKFFDEDDLVGYAGNCINWVVLKRQKKKTYMQTVYAKLTDPAFELGQRTKHGGYMNADDIIDSADGEN